MLNNSGALLRPHVWPPIWWRSQQLKYSRNVKLYQQRVAKHIPRVPSPPATHEFEISTDNKDQPLTAIYANIIKRQPRTTTDLRWAHPASKPFVSNQHHDQNACYGRSKGYKRRDSSYAYAARSEYINNPLILQGYIDTLATTREQCYSCIRIRAFDEVRHTCATLAMHVDAPLICQRTSIYVMGNLEHHNTNFCHLKTYYAEILTPSNGLFSKPTTQRYSRQRRIQKLPENCYTASTLRTAAGEAQLQATLPT